MKKEFEEIAQMSDPQFVAALLELLVYACIAKFGEQKPVCLMIFDDDKDWVSSNTCPHRIKKELREALEAIEENPLEAKPKCVDCPYDVDEQTEIDKCKYLH